MDYFFWDEIFGGRQGLGDYWREEPPAPDAELPSERVSVIIAYVEHFTGPHTT